MEVDTHQLAEILGVTTSRIGHFVRDGAPVKVRGGRGVAHIFDSREFFKWRDKVVSDDVERLTMEEARLKKLTAEAGISELELAKKKNQVADLDEIEEDLKNRFAVLRTSIRSVPERVVMQLIGLKDEAKIKKIILKEIDDTLERLSDE
jgi:phage terminase Nu1 subunit (DNA packaging protein)